MAVATNCLNLCKQAFMHWSKMKFGAGTRKIKDVSRQLERLQSHENSGNVETIKEVQLELHKLLKMEDLKWKQRAKRNWYTKGDRNTKFFHAWASQRKRRNFIEKVTDVEGNQWTNPEDLERVFVQHFQQLFAIEGTRGY
jgi:hypothetical protein